MRLKDANKRNEVNTLYANTPYQYEKLCKEDKKQTFNLSKLQPYSSEIVVPLYIIPLPVIIHVPERTLVIVDGKLSSSAECIVTPISMVPAHFITTCSRSTSKISPGFKGLLVMTTALLKSFKQLVKKQNY